MERRVSPHSPVFFPDWIVSRRLSRDLRNILLRYARGRFLDVGAGNAPYRELLRNRIECYTALDLSPAPGIDVVGSALDLPFDAASYDVIFSSQVLEHVTNPQRMLMELSRVVKPNGCVVISAPQYWPEHEIPYDFSRFTIHGLRELGRVAGLKIIDERRQGGGFAVAGQAINNTLAERLHFSNEAVSRGRKLIVAAALFPMFMIINVLFETLDKLIPSRYDTLNLVVVFRRTA